MTTGTRLIKRLDIILFIAVFLTAEILFGYFIQESKKAFTENSIKDGGYLALAQTEKIEARMQDYAFSVELAGKYLDEMIQAQTPEAEIQKWMNSYCHKITDRFGGNTLDLYAVLDNSIVAANPWEGDDGYDFSPRPWYTGAMAAKPGTIVFSDLYVDAVTGQNVFTMSLALSRPGDVVAMDVYLTSENWMGFSELPEAYSLQLYDSRHALAYSLGSTGIHLLGQDVLDSASDLVSYYAPASTMDTNLYICQLSNGWSVVITIPTQKLMSSYHMFLMNLGFGLNIMNFLIFSAILLWYIRSSKALRHDALTGLLNRTYLMRQIDRLLKRSGGTLLVVDLDNFKTINDNYGHKHGDVALIQVAEILRSCFRGADCIGRFGGDEFIVFANASTSEEMLEASIREMLRRIGELAQRYPLSDLSVSVGGCRCEKGDRYTEVFQCADAALYQIKKNGKCGFTIYSHA